MRLRWRLSTLLVAVACSAMLIAIVAPLWRVKSVGYASTAGIHSRRFLIKSPAGTESLDLTKVRFVRASGEPIKPEVIKPDSLVRVTRVGGRVVLVEFN